MSWNFTIQFLDESNNVLATETATTERVSWKSPLKTEITLAEDKNIVIDWKKLSILVEKA